jgi:cell division protein FtsB
MFDSIEKKNYKDFLGKLFTYILILYVFFIMFRSVWMNWKLNQQISLIKKQIETTKEQNRNLENLIVYYQSDSFKEVEARRKLGLKKPGEKVIAVPAKTYVNYQAETEAEKQRLSESDDVDDLPNWKAWYQFLFK